MASFDTLLPTIPVDYVAVYSQDEKPIAVFPRAKAIKATVKEMSKAMEHPVENGTIITDHRVLLPVEIELAMFLQAPDYADVYKTIRQYYLNATLLTVQTRSAVYTNQFIVSMPHEETTDQYDTLSIALSLKQVQFVAPQFGVNPKNKKNSTLLPRGTQQGTPATTDQRTTAKRIYDRVFPS